MQHHFSRSKFLLTTYEDSYVLKIFHVKIGFRIQKFCFFIHQITVVNPENVKFKNLDRLPKFVLPKQLIPNKPVFNYFHVFLKTNIIYFFQ